MKDPTSGIRLAIGQGETASIDRRRQRDEFADSGSKSRNLSALTSKTDIDSGHPAAILTSLLHLIRRFLNPSLFAQCCLGVAAVGPSPYPPHIYIVTHSRNASTPTH